MRSISFASRLRPGDESMASPNVGWVILVTTPRRFPSVRPITPRLKWRNIPASSDDEHSLVTAGVA